MAISETNRALCDDAVERLVQENRALSEQLRIWTQTVRAVLENLPVAVLVADKEGRISVINRAFAQCLDYETRQSGSLTGCRIEQLFDHEAVARFYDTLHTGKKFDDLVMEVGPGRLRGSVIPLVDGDSAMITLCDTRCGTQLDRDITVRIESVIDQNMAMVQKIGYLLGEEMSQSTEKLNSIIRYIEEAAGKDER